jgi:hypothetical protein
MPGQKFHHSLKEHHKISNIPKFRCEMLYNADNIALRSLPFFSNFALQTIFVPRDLLTRGATRGSGQIHNRIPWKHGTKTISGVRTSQSDASSDMDLARAPRRTARKKGSGYENDYKREIDNQMIKMIINFPFVIQNDWKSANFARIYYYYLFKCMTYLQVLLEYKKIYKV